MREWYQVDLCVTTNEDFHDSIDVFLRHHLYAEVSIYGEPTVNTYLIGTCELDYNPADDEFDGGMDFYDFLEELKSLGLHGRWSVAVYKATKKDAKAYTEYVWQAAYDGKEG